MKYELTFTAEDTIKAGSRIDPSSVSKETRSNLESLNKDMRIMGPEGGAELSLQKCVVLFVLAIIIEPNKCDSILMKKMENNQNENSRELDFSSERGKSLGRLIHHLTKEYFQGCDVVMYLDENFDSGSTIAFPNIYQNLSFVSFFTVGINDTNSQKSGGPQRKDKCYNYMIFLEDIFNMEKIMKKEARNKILIISRSTPWTVQDFLKSYASRFYVNLLVVTHSISQRTKEGTYLLYTHKLYTDGSGRSESYLLTSWVNNSLTKPGTNLFPEKLTEGFWGHRILISAAHMPPFAIRKNQLTSDSVTWDGIDVRMVRLMGEVLNFTAEFRDATSTTLSPIAAAVNDVRLGVAAAAIGGIYRNLEIVTEFDSSTAHIQDCASFISLASTALPKYRAVMGPFQLSVWLLLCAVYIIAIIPLSMNSHYSLKSLLTKPGNLESMFWYVFSTFTNSFNVKNPMLNSGLGQNATSILIGIYWVFTIIITSCYTGSIMAFITVPVYPTAMETADQLLRNRYQIATLDHDGWEKWFNYTRLDDPLAIKLLKNVEYVPTVKDGVKNASQAYFWPYAFLGSQTLLEYIVQADFAPNWATKRSLMHISSECFVRYEVTMVLPIESIYTETFNKVIIRARQSGLAQKIVRDVEWDVQRSSTGKLLSVSGDLKLQRVSVKERQLALDDAQGIFLILGAGILIGIFVLIIECCIHNITKRCKPIWIHRDSEISSRISHERDVDIWLNDYEDDSRRRYSSNSI